MTTIDQAVQQMRAAGLPQLPDGHPRTNGRIQRFGPGKKSWYVLREVMLRNGSHTVHGAFGTWQGTHTASIKIEVDWAGVSSEERADLERRLKEQDEREREEREQRAANAANRACQQWNSGTTQGESPYAQRKQIMTPGLRFLEDGTMLVPMLLQGQDGPVMVGLQKIAPDGTKTFNKGMSKIGAFCPVGRAGADDKVIFSSEGYATGRTIREALDDTVPGFVTFDAGNMLAVLQSVRARYPDAHILICADDDFVLEPRLHRDLAQQYGIEGVVVDGVERTFIGKEGEYKITSRWLLGIADLPYIEAKVSGQEFTRVMRYENTGRVKAHEAAAVIGNASVAIPVFTDRGDQKLTDWNDLRCVEGLAVCKRQLEAAVLAALMPAMVKVAQAEQALQLESGDVDVDLEGRDDLFDQARAVIKTHGKAAISHLQRHLRIGYNRAARILDQLEQAGVVGPMLGNGARVVLSSTAGPAAAEEVDRRETSPVDAEPENSELTWQARLARTERGQVLPVLSNVVAILKSTPEWDGVIAYEEFSGQVVKLKPPPYDRGETGEWTDMDDLRTALWLQQQFSFHPREDIVMKAVLLAADSHSHHVVRSYLEPLIWDGIERLSSWMVRFLGAEDMEYVRRVSRKFLIGGVARIYRPGCKMDNVLILEGTQGLKKSTALKVLAGEWFTDAPLRFGDKDSYAIMRGKWFIELAELDSFNKADSEAAKQFFGQYIDRYRNFYGKRASDVPRQQVFAGSTNKYVYLKDETGNRRYWPVRALLIDLAGLAEVRDQLWAEALIAFRAGEPFWETPDDVPLFREQQEARFVNDSYTDLIADGLVGKNSITVTDVLHDILKLDVAKWTMPEQQRVGRSLGQLGWMRKRGREKHGKREWIYVRPELGSDGAERAEDSKGDDESPI